MHSKSLEDTRLTEAEIIKVVYEFMDRYPDMTGEDWSLAAQNDRWGGYRRELFAFMNGRTGPDGNFLANYPTPTFDSIVEKCFMGQIGRPGSY